MQGIEGGSGRDRHPIKTRDGQPCIHSVERERTNFFVNQALDFALFESFDEPMFGSEIDNLGIRVSEVELLEKIV